MSATLSLDSLLQVAILEQQQAQSIAALRAAPFVDSLALCQLGQDYEERLVQSKMRALAVFAPPPPSAPPAAVAANLLSLLDPTAVQLGAAACSSTGSSSRSSPLAAAIGGVQLSASAPNSPAAVAPAVTASATAAAVVAPPVAVVDVTRKRSAGALGVAPLLTSRAANAGSHSTRQSRAAHNALEKNRRANLRSFLDRLKASVPAEAESARSTTLSLLTQARNAIRVLNRQQQTLVKTRDAAAAENAKLRERLAQLKAHRDGDIATAVVAPVDVVAAVNVESVVAPVVVAAAAAPTSPQTAPTPLAKPQPIVAAAVAPLAGSSALFADLTPTAAAATVVKPIISPLAGADLTAALGVLIPQLTVDDLRALVALQQPPSTFAPPPPPPSRQPHLDMLVNQGLVSPFPLSYPYPYSCQQTAAASNAF